jgi:hypothetical protein
MLSWFSVQACTPTRHVQSIPETYSTNIMLALRYASLRGAFRQAAWAPGHCVHLESHQKPTQLARSLYAHSRSKLRCNVGSSAAQTCRVCGCRARKGWDQAPRSQPRGPQPPLGGRNGRSWGGGDERFSHMVACSAPVQAPATSAEEVILLDVGGVALTGLDLDLLPWQH